MSPNTNNVDVLLDGSIRSAVTVTVVTGGNPDSWGPGDVVRIDINAPDLPAGDHRVKLIINNDEEVFEFNT